MDYEALIEVIGSVCEKFGKRYSEMGIPKIGCGLAGGNWERVEAILQQISLEYGVDFIVYEL